MLILEIAAGIYIIRSIKPLIDLFAEYRQHLDDESTERQIRLNMEIEELKKRELKK